MHPNTIPTIDAHTHVFHPGGLCVLQSELQETTNTLYSVGIHPKNSRILSESECDQLKNRLSSPLCIAVGECGLDTQIDIPMDLQEEVFIFQLKLAKVFDKPIILHCVNSWDRCRHLHGVYAPEQPIIYHGFAKASIIEQVISHPLAIISIGHRILTTKPLQEIVSKIPDDRLLVETDDADIDIMEIYRRLAELKSVPLPALTETLYGNFKRIFNVKLA